MDPEPAARSMRSGFTCPACGAKGGFSEKEPNRWSCSQCERDFGRPEFLIRHDPTTGIVAEVEIAPMMRLDFDRLLDGGLTFDEAWRWVSERRVTFPEGKEHVRGIVDQWRKNPEVIHIGEGKRIETGGDSKQICLVRPSRDGTESRLPIISKPFLVLRRVDVEGEPRAVVVDAAGQHSGNYNEVLKRLRANAQILNPTNSETVLAHLINSSQNHSKGHAAYGVYAAEGKIEIAREILPKTVAQRETLDALAAHLDREPTPEEWQAYADYAARYEPREWMVAYGLAAAAPFAPVLRAHRIALPGIFLLSISSGVGKSYMATACATRLWGIPLASANTLNSDFRFSLYLDSGATLRAYDEAQRFKWAEYGDLVKQAFESSTISTRGTRDLAVVTFMSRATVLFTGNHLPNLPRSVLNRFLVVRFNEGRARLHGEEADKFERLHESLRLVGPRLAHAGVKLCEGSESNLVSSIRETLRAKIEAVRTEWHDARRPGQWAVVYWGLKIWELASGGIIAAPSIEEFVAKVVDPVEEAGQRSVMDPLMRLRDWIRQYRAKNTSTRRTMDSRQEIMMEEFIRGDGELFTTTTDFGRSGHLVTTAFLDLYNRDQREDAEAKIGNLQDLAQSVHSQYGIPLTEMMGGRGARVHKIGGRSVRAVFVPDEDPSDNHQSKIGADGSDGMGGARAPDAGDSDPTMRKDDEDLFVMIGWLRREMASYPDGVPRGRLFELANASGMGFERAKMGIRSLLESSVIREIKDGHYCTDSVPVTHGDGKERKVDEQPI